MKMTKLLKNISPKTVRRILDIDLDRPVRVAPEKPFLRKLEGWSGQIPFSHHYQGRIEFNTVNLFHSTGMDSACILASRVGLTNPLPRAKIDQSSPCRGLSTPHPRAMNTQ